MEGGLQEGLVNYQKLHSLVDWFHLRQLLEELLLGALVGLDRLSWVEANNGYIAIVVVDTLGSEVLQHSSELALKNSDVVKLLEGLLNSGQFELVEVQLLHDFWVDCL